MATPKEPASPPGFQDAQSMFTAAQKADAGPVKADDTTFGAALIRHMDQSGIGAAELSRKSNVSKAQIDKLRQRKSRTTNVDDAMRLAAAFGMTLEDFCAVSGSNPGGNTMKTTSHPQDSADHPIWGCMAGTITLPDGVDLTDPAFSDDEMEGFLERKSALLHGLPR
jgi:transcriptional regulator with XRE-family HTH domain